MPRSLLVPAVALVVGCHRLEPLTSVERCVCTVPSIEWTTEEPGVSWVEYGLDESYGTVTPVVEQASTEHAFSLLGLPPLSEVYYRAVTEIDGVEWSEEGIVSTCGIPSDLPDFDVTVELPDDYASDRYVLGTAFGVQPVVFVLDRRGNWMWYRRVEPDKNPIELAFEQGTGHLLFNSFLTDHGEDDSNVTRVSFDCELAENIDTPLAHHAFTQLPDGSMAYVAIDVRDGIDLGDGRGEVSVVGDAIWLIPADGGEHRLIWNSFDDWRDIERTGSWDSGFYPQGFDWTHANALHYSEERDSYLLSLRNFDTILEIASDGGFPLYEYGGTHGFGFAPDSRPFEYQHDPDWTADGTLLMISTPSDTRETVAIEYQVDAKNRLLVEVWSHGDGLGHFAQVQGSARDLANGSRMVNFGSLGLAQEVTQDNEVVWELSARAGAAFGNTITFDDMYDPLGLGE